MHANLAFSNTDSLSRVHLSIADRFNLIIILGGSIYEIKPAPFTYSPKKVHLQWYNKGLESTLFGGGLHVKAYIVRIIFP